MKLIIIADTFIPFRSSGAVQLFDLSRELLRQGHTVTVLVPEVSAQFPLWNKEFMEGVEVYRVRAPKIKDVHYIRRTIAEWMTPYIISFLIRMTPLKSIQWDGIIWYSPSIFLTPLVRHFKDASQCRAYLIIRDMFPEWIHDMGMLSSGHLYNWLRRVANHQFQLADVIGIQSEGNFKYFQYGRRLGWRKKVEILQNWLTFSYEKSTPCRIDLSKTPLAGRTLFVYAGNMGIAQGMEKLLCMAETLANNDRIGFVFVGRGTEYTKLLEKTQKMSLTNVWFHDEIDPEEIPGLYAQCHFGLVSLDQRHHSHNIPGKFISYMHAGLPVLACVNPGNDLARLISSERVGKCCVNDNPGIMAAMAQELACCTPDEVAELRINCLNLAKNVFSSETAAKQIERGLFPDQSI